MEIIKFGPSGNSAAFAAAGGGGTVRSAAWVKGMGLDCFEYSFGRGVNLSDAAAYEIGRAFDEAGIEISAHAPYYVNFSNPDDAMAEKSYAYVINSAKKLKAMGGKRVVFHPASQGKLQRDEAVSLAKERLVRLAEVIEEEKLTDMFFCPETMGKLGQIGTIEEVTDFCKIADFYVPAVDFGHVNARERGSLKTKADFASRLAYMTRELGYEKMKRFHVHFSKIEYSAKGEVRHLTFEDDKYGPEFLPFAQALIEAKLYPYVVCESAGTQDVDALAMKTAYNSLLNE